MTGQQPTELVAELVCDRCGDIACGYDQTVDSLRDTLGGWASCVAGYDDLCPDCCEVVPLAEEDMREVVL